MKVYISLMLLICQIAYTNTQTACNLITPATSTDCTSKSVDKKEYCCYLYAPNLISQNNKLCYGIPFESYSGGKTYSLNSNTYLIDCGVSINSSPLDTCSPDAHGSQKECATGSSFTNSCCYEDATKQCYWLGTKYSGDTLWAGKKLHCSGEYISVSLMLLIAFLSILF
jgi:hypothetical protein